jgi:hypothetical protein
LVHHFNSGAHRFTSTTCLPPLFSHRPSATRYLSDSLIEQAKNDLIVIVVIYPPGCVVDCPPPFCFRLGNQRRLMTDVFCGDVSAFWTHINLPRLELSAKAGPNYCPRWADTC